MKYGLVFSLLWFCPGATCLLPAALSVTHDRRCYPSTCSPAQKSYTCGCFLQESRRKEGGSKFAKRDEESGKIISNGPPRRQHLNKPKRNNPQSYKGRKQGQGIVSTKRQKAFDALLERFQSPQEIDAWMETIVEEHIKSKSSLHPFDSSWSSRDETDFIRYLRDRGAYQALEQYTCFVARRNVYVCTAAISALSSCKDRSTRRRALLILDKMDEAGVHPSSFTFASLFRSIDGPEEARNLMMSRLQKYKGRTAWSTAAFNQAIMACARKHPRQHHPTNKSWQVALEFLHNFRTEGLIPDWKTYTSLLNVCAQTGQLKIALSLAREIESNPDIAANSRVWGALLNVAAQAGDYKKANEVLVKMQESGHKINLAHCSALLKALSRNGLVKLSFQVLDLMTDSHLASEISNQASSDLELANLPRVAPDLVALNTILASCAKAKDFTAARKLLDCMKNGEFCGGRSLAPIYPDEISYSLLLSSCREPMAARAIVKEMQLSRRYRVGVVRPSNITYARAIAVCRKADVPDVESARLFLSSARKDGVEPTVFMYTAAIWTAERSGNYSFAKGILGEMKAEGVEPNGISYTGVISAAARAGLTEEALALYKDFKETGGLPSAAMYNALAMAVRHAQTPKKLEALESIFMGMDGADRLVDVGGSVIEALITEYGRIGAYTDAKKIFDSINGPCNGPCLRAILNACATADPEPKWEEAVSILHSSDITLNAIGPGHTDQGALGNAMIACAKADRWEEGLNLLLLYGVRTKRSSSISIAALNSVMAACGRGGRPDAAVSILNEMEKRYGVRPDARSYRSAVIACNQAEHHRRHQEKSAVPVEAMKKQNEPVFQWWECALALLRRMKEDGLKPDIQTLSSCISACEAAGQWQRALGVLQSMIDENSDDEEFLNLFCFNAAISACEKGGAWVEALEIYERMISHGGLLQPNFVTLSSLVLALANAGQKELAGSKYEEGLKLKIVNPWRKTKDLRGQLVKAMDLHNFNSAIASSAVRSHLDLLLLKDSGVEEDLIIIVGKGLRSSEGVKLLPAIQNLLLEEYGIAVEVDSENTGRLVIDAGSLTSLIAGRSWSDE